MGKELLESSSHPAVVDPEASSNSQPRSGNETSMPPMVIAARPRSSQTFPNRTWSIIGLSITGLLVAMLIGLFFLAWMAPSSSRPASSSSSQTGSQNTAPQVTVPPHGVYNARPPAAPAGNTVPIKLVIQEKLIAIAPDVAFHAWTFNGTVPGPILRVRQGQTIHFTLVNNGTMPHSIDFHAAETPWNVSYQPVAAGKSFSFDWQAMFPGVFMYHCGTPPVIMHIANGMYGMIIVDPAGGWSSAREYGLVQSEFYTQQNADGTSTGDYQKMLNRTPDAVVFNGYANQYQAAPLTVRAGQRLRLFVLNAGPTEFSAFHTIGAMFDDVYLDGNPANHLKGMQTVTIPPGGGAVVELTMTQPGRYPFVTHSFADASIGALGVINVIP